MAEGGKDQRESRSPTARSRAARHEANEEPTRQQAREEATRQPTQEGPRQSRRTRVARTRPERYLIAVAPPADVRILASEFDQEPDTRLLKTIGTARATDGPSAIVVETPGSRAAALASVGHLRVEPDERLDWASAWLPGAAGTQGLFGAAGGGPRAVAPVGDLHTVQVLVSNDAGRPVQDAEVWLTGPGGPATGYTGADGHAELTVPVETAVDPDAMWVRPARGCWPALVNRPEIEPGQSVTAVCERVVTTFPDFPERALQSWGARSMGFGMLPPTHRGNGVRLALIGSGVAAGHPDLSGRVSDGLDVITQNQKGWQEDPIGTGTHLAVLLAGRDDGTGVVGLAPEAELHVCRTAPGGHCSDLVEALDYCIAKDVDIALITVSMRHPTAMLAEKVAQARAHGVACIAAAGDGAGPIGYPAALPGVLAVGAVGMAGTFPLDSGLAVRMAGPPGIGGFFAPAFASQGPGIDCCGPGVAIVSGLPPTSYGPLDGTAVAAAHVAGAAALVLAHHPGLRTPSGVKNDEARVGRLFSILLASCRPLPGVSPAIAGAGLPDVAAAMGIAGWAWP